jgi:hypothetical protein
MERLGHVAPDAIVKVPLTCVTMPTMIKPVRCVEVLAHDPHMAAM